MPKCQVCNNENVIQIDFISDSAVTSDGKYIETPLKHNYCHNCGYIFIDEKLQLNYTNFYQEDYDFLTESEEIEPVILNQDTQLKYSDNLVEFFSEFIEKNNNKTFFDIGAGKGNFINAVYNRYPELGLYALEPSKSYKQLQTKAFLKEHYNKFFNLNDFTGKKFDYISLIGVLEHVKNPKDFLHDITQIMNNESYLFIEVPNFKNNKTDLLCIDHISKFTFESIKNLFNITGFEIIKQYIPDTAIPMQFIVKKSFIKEIQNNRIDNTISNAVNYLSKAMTSVKKIKGDFAIYGQGLIAKFFLCNGTFNKKHLKVLIDDNKLYHNSKWENLINIVGFEDFKTIYDVKNVFLAMNDCYHPNVIKKLDDYIIFGATK